MAPDTKAQRAREARSPHTGDAATAEVIARFGQDNLETILEVYRAFADRVDYRALMAWTIKDPLEDLLLPVFLRALIEITSGLRLGELAQELAAARSEHVPAGDLADTLHATAHDLQAHIKARAQEIAQPLVDEERMICARIAAERNAEMESMRQRKDDLIAELRRQLNAQVRQVERLHPENKALKATVGRVREVRCWENEDGKWFAFRDDLFAALNGDEDPS